jgi:hypothetical protein
MGAGMIAPGHERYGLGFDGLKRRHDVLALMPAGSSLGLMTTKSLYITG